MWELELENKLTSLLKENNAQKHQIEELKRTNNQELNSLFNSLLEVLDTFDKAEAVIKERELDKTEESQKAVKRLLLAKKKLEQIIAERGIEVITYENNMYDNNTCVSSETVPNPGHPNDYIVETIKKGYVLNGTVLIVRN